MCGAFTATQHRSRLSPTRRKCFRHKASYSCVCAISGTWTTLLSFGVIKAKGQPASALGGAGVMGDCTGETGCVSVVGCSQFVQRPHQKHADKAPTLVSMLC